MRVLVVVASRFGSSREIAEAIGRHLRLAGHTGDVVGVAEVAEVAPYDAVVLGSGIYNRRWPTAMTEFMNQNRAGLASRPLWLFSVGSFSSAERWPWGVIARQEPEGIESVLATLHPRDYHVFAGAVDPKQVGAFGRLVYTLFRGRCGDYRNWREVADWATAIGRELTDPAPSEARRSNARRESERAQTQAP